MKPYIILLINLMLLLGGNVAAQNAIANIRSYYNSNKNQVAACIAQSEHCILYNNILTINGGELPWRAVGEYKKELMFWYDDSPMHCEDCGKDGINSLKFITSSSTSGTSQIYKEWLFKEGILIFHYVKFEGEYPSEIRYYYDNDILIRYIDNGEPVDALSAKAKDSDNIKNKAQQHQKSFLIAFE